MQGKLEAERANAFGEDYRLTRMDRFGMWLSLRQIRRYAGGFQGKDVADVGCGYAAIFMRSFLHEVASCTLVDISLSETLKRHEKVRAIEGRLPAVLERIPTASLDFVVCNNVLEHLWEPEVAIRHFHRILRRGGSCFLNVPSWRGKFVLETAAFRLKWTSKEEIDDHKAYYDWRQLWELVVRSGFKPSNVYCRSHKFSLNTYAFCRAS